MPYKKPTDSDTRGWRGQEVGDTKPEIAGSRTGENETPRTTAKVSYPSGDAREPEKSVDMDNMGNSPTIGGKNKTVRESAITVENLPAVPMSSYEGVSVGDGGVKLDGSFKVEPHEREIREKTDHAPKVPNIVGGTITSSHEKFKQAIIPGGFESIKESQFTGDGANPSNVESSKMGDKNASKFSGEFKSTAKAQK